ncbi:MAG: hypothetical protein ACRDBY_14135 [Cetobacterium sp.]
MLENLIKDLNKKYKNNIIQSGTDTKEIEKIPFSSSKANYVTRGGIPKNKMTEFFGAESSGKTTSALDIISNFQKSDKRLVVYLDAENTINKEWGEVLGVDWSRVLLIKPENQFAETLLDMVLDCIKSGEVGLCVIDSVPFLVPKAVMENELENKTYAGNSTVMTTFCSKVIPLMNKYETTLLMINQVRDKLGVTYTAYNTPGGRMLRHSYAFRVFFSKGNVLDELGNEKSSSYEHPCGIVVNMKIEKNKVSKPDRKLGNYTLNFTTGVESIGDCIRLGVMLGVIQQGGSWFTYKDIKVQGEPKLIKALKENDTLLQELLKEVNSKALED